MKCESCGAVLGEHEHRCSCGWWVHGNEEYERGFNAAIDKAVETIHKVVEDTGIPQDFDMNDLLDIEWDIAEELNKLKENI